MRRSRSAIGSAIAGGGRVSDRLSRRHRLHPAVQLAVRFLVDATVGRQPLHDPLLLPIPFLARLRDGGVARGCEVLSLPAQGARLGRLPAGLGRCEAPFGGGDPGDEILAALAIGVGDRLHVGRFRQRHAGERLLLGLEVGEVAARRGHHGGRGMGEALEAVEHGLEGDGADHEQRRRRKQAPPSPGMERDRGRRDLGELGHRHDHEDPGDGDAGDGPLIAADAQVLGQRDHQAGGDKGDLDRPGKPAKERRLAAVGGGERRVGPARIRLENEGLVLQHPTSPEAWPLVGNLLTGAPLGRNTPQLQVVNLSLPAGGRRVNLPLPCSPHVHAPCMRCA